MEEQNYQQNQHSKLEELLYLNRFNHLELNCLSLSLV